MVRARKLIVNDDILLKEIGPEDVTAIFTIIDNEREYLGKFLLFIESTREISHTRSFVDSYINSDKTDLTCSIYFQNQFVGLIGLKDTDLVNKKTEIGYWLSESFQRKGIITLSAHALINYVFREMDMNRIQLKAATKNLRSQGVAERLGFTREGIEREGELHTRGYFDLVVYSLLKSDRT